MNQPLVESYRATIYCSPRIDTPQPANRLNVFSTARLERGTRSKEEFLSLLKEEWGESMEYTVMIYRAEEGGYGAEVPALPTRLLFAGRDD